MSHDYRYSLPNDEPGKTYRPCNKCGSRDFISSVKGMECGHVSEVETVCTNCNNLHLYWAFGSYNPSVGFETIEEAEKYERWSKSIDFKG